MFVADPIDSGGHCSCLCGCSACELERFGQQHLQLRSVKRESCVSAQRFKERVAHCTTSFMRDCGKSVLLHDRMRLLTAHARLHCRHQHLCGCEEGKIRLQLGLYNILIKPALV